MKRFLLTYAAIAAIFGATIAFGEPIRDGGYAIAHMALEDETPKITQASLALANVMPFTVKIVGMEYYDHELADGKTEKRLGPSSGSGVILRSGYVITNKHVICDVIGPVTVVFSDGTTKPGIPISDPKGAVDVGVVKVQTGDKTLPRGSSLFLVPGDDIYTIGHPHNYAFSCNKGIVSGLHRNLPKHPDGVCEHKGLFQIDAQINKGNSGGPVINSVGKVVGLAVAKADADGIGFAIPIEPVVTEAERLIAESEAKEKK